MMMIKEKKNRITAPVIAALMLLWALPSTAQQISIKTNALTDLGMLPNIGVELVVGEKSSLDFGVTSTVAKPWGLPLSTTMGSFQYRYWIPQRAMTQLFIGVGAKAGCYEYTKDNNVTAGDFATAELIGGYAWPIAKRWNLEVSYGFGLLMRHQYEKETTAETAPAPTMKYDLATTTVGVSFVYIIK